MRGWVAISVTATPAAAPRRIREVLRIIIREPSGLRLRPTKGLDRQYPVLAELRIEYGLGTGWFTPPAWQRPIVVHFCDGLRAGPSERISLHPTEQNMISAAGIKDQGLTIIVTMMLIELALLRLSRATFFK